MRGVVSKRLARQAEDSTVGERDHITRARKQELKVAYKSKTKFIKPVKLSKRQQRLAA